MSFLKRLFKRYQAQDQSPRTCPRLEHLSGYGGREYWCDRGAERIKIANLIYSYADLKPDHIERACKGKYQKCPLF